MRKIFACSIHEPAVLISECRTRKTHICLLNEDQEKRSHFPLSRPQHASFHSSGYGKLLALLFQCTSDACKEHENIKMVLLGFPERLHIASYISNGFRRCSRTVHLNTEQLAINSLANYWTKQPI